MQTLLGVNLRPRIEVGLGILAIELLHLAR